MNTETEINHGYIPVPSSLQQPSRPPRWRSFSSRFKEAISYRNRKRTEVVRLPFLILTSFIMVVWLKLYLWIKQPKASQLYNEAIGQISEFVTQYPLHLYPIICKSFELAVLKDTLQGLIQDDSRLLEVAIGEGSLSKKIFPPSAKVVGLDINPYSLKNAAQMAHVKLAIVCDGLQPPIQDGSFDILVANNFLHHVTHKEETLAHWAKLAETALFNENTPYWGSGWFIPYVLKNLGMKRAASCVEAHITRQSIQHLEFKTKLDGIISKRYEIIDVVSYMSERTFSIAPFFHY